MKKILAGAAMVPLAFIAVFLLLFAGGGPDISATTTSCTDNTTATGQLSAAQLAAADYAAGVRNGSDSPDASPLAGPNTLTIFVALTMPESGANASAVQQGQPYATTGWGVYQVTPGNSEPQCGTDEKLLNLLANVCAAVAKLKVQGLKAWTTYQQGLYVPYMAWAAAGVANMSLAGLSCQAVQLSSPQVDAQISTTGQVVQEATPPSLPSRFDGFPAGQCTYWVALHFPVAWHGDAWQWWANAAAAGAQETQTPAVGSVVVYGRGNGYSDLGHVAYVIQVNSDDTFVVSEMNFLGVGIVDERTSTLSDVDGFIL